MPFMTLWKEGDPLESESTDEATRPADNALVRRWSHSRFDPGAELEHTIDRYEIVREGEVVASEEHTQSPATRSYTQAQAIALYEKAGLENIQVFHDFTFEPVSPGDTVFCVLGFKPK
jgi:hypothetical protein